ncbi:helix-turn-helix domain-containing protein [Reinekea marinisedimentorum]|uniref:Helix-turn-helix protein n=1 Tax=Reinekea marinisedimentorum TaxID=230495 RepID=A0A4R3ICL9_9GAMM|nr:helix-turn-helix domain-containing protein [Reinekea marinisedimentorum]TCS43147.1 helix-turn-helix protein [Reinekea marinisedimentorum]
MNVGTRLKELRVKSGLSQRELAKRVGVTNSTISMIEKNNVSPSISSLEKILSGMSMSLLSFFEVEEDAVFKPQAAYTESDFKDVSSSQVHRKMLGQFFPNRQLDFTVETFPPGAERSVKALVELGDKAGYLLEGQLVLTVGEKTDILDQYHGFYFSSTEEHFFRNEGQVAAKMVVVRCCH